MSDSSFPAHSQRSWVEGLLTAERRPPLCPLPPCTYLPHSTAGTRRCPGWTEVEGNTGETHAAWVCESAEASTGACTHSTPSGSKENARLNHEPETPNQTLLAKRPEGSELGAPQGEGGASGSSQARTASRLRDWVWLAPGRAAAGSPPGHHEGAGGHFQNLTHSRNNKHRGPRLSGGTPGLFSSRVHSVNPQG